MNSLYTRLIILYEVVLIPLKCYTETINRKPSSINNYTREVRFVMQKKERKRILINKITFATTIYRRRLWSLQMLVLHLYFIFQKNWRLDFMCYILLTNLISISYLPKFRLCNFKRIIYILIILKTPLLTWKR